MNPDFERLLSAVIPIAQRMLKDLGAFVPFGAFITRDGEVQLAGGQGDPSGLQLEDIVHLYLDAYREAASRGDFTATALCVDVRIHLEGKPEKSEAIEIMLENSAGEAVNTFLPYQKRDNSEVAYSSLFAQITEPQVFLKLASEREQ